MCQESVKAVEERLQSIISNARAMIDLFLVRRQASESTIQVD